MLYNTGDIRLDGITAIGNIIIKSEGKITIPATCSLTDVVLIAEEIEFETGFKGSAQAFSTKKILVGERVELTYPSALVVMTKEEGTPIANTIEQAINIEVKPSSIVNGVIVYAEENGKNNFNTQVKLWENTLVRGEVYCNQNIELMGIVEGSIFARGFMANQFGSMYQNHIYNGKVSEKALPTEYAGLLLDGKKKGVVKWLY